MAAGLSRGPVPLTQHPCPPPKSRSSFPATTSWWSCSATVTSCCGWWRTRSTPTCSCGATRSASAGTTPTGWDASSTSWSCSSDGARSSTRPTWAAPSRWSRPTRSRRRSCRPRCCARPRAAACGPRPAARSATPTPSPATSSPSPSAPPAPASRTWPWPRRCRPSRPSQVSRIILTRPAVEAGERLGFLPGDMLAKVDPYLRPLYDALYDMLGPEGAKRLLDGETIEVAPLAYMRGRTLNDSFLILDEAQNTTPEQMKMFLTRIGFGQQGGRHRRRHPGRPGRRPQRPARAGEGPHRHRRPGLRPPHVEGRRPPPHRAGHRRRLRAGHPVMTARS